MGHIVMGQIARSLPILFLSVLAASVGLPANAQTLEEFYRGKQISLVIGTSPGGDYDLRGRMLARYMGKDEVQRFIAYHTVAEKRSA